MLHARKIIYVTFNYPPNSTVASLQHKYMVSHLRGLGWEVDVVTIREDDLAREVGENDVSLLSPLEDKNICRVRYTSLRNMAIRMKGRVVDIPGRAFRTEYRGNRREASERGPNVSSSGRLSKIKDFVSDELFSFPDRHSGWIWNGYVVAKEIARRKGSGIVFASGPPHSTLVIGYLLKKKLGLPLVLEFRDPWSGNPYSGPRSSLFLRFERRLQAKILRSADFIRASTGNLMRQLLSIEPLCEGKISVGSAGFPDFVRDGEEKHPERMDRPYTITHAGTLYTQRNPKNFLQAARRLLAEGVIPSDKLRIRLLGKSDIGDSEYLGLVNDPLLVPVVERGEISHAACVKSMLKSDLLLSFQQGTKLQVPAKIYEYLSLGRPMLTIADKESATWDLIHREGFGECVPDEPDVIYRAICREYSSRNGTGAQRFYPNAEKFSFRALSARFHVELERLLIKG